MSKIFEVMFRTTYKRGDHNTVSSIRARVYYNSGRIIRYDSFEKIPRTVFKWVQDAKLSSTRLTEENEHHSRILDEIYTN